MVSSAKKEIRKKKKKKHAHNKCSHIKYSMVHPMLGSLPPKKTVCSSNIGAAELNIYGPAKGRGCLPTFVVLSAAVLQRSQCSGRKKKS